MFAQNTTSLRGRLAVSSLPRVSLVIPTYNEALNLPHIADRLPSWAYEVIIVDGPSTDGTVDVAKRLIPDVRIVYQDGRGKGNALACGFRAAEGDIIVMLDADGSTRPEEISAFVGALLDGADYAKGSRFLQGGGTADMPLLRQMGNFFFISLIRLLFGGRYTDLCYGYNAFWLHALDAVMPDCDGFEVETLMNIRALKHGLAITEVMSFEDERIHGEGHLNTFRDGWRVLKTIFREAGRGLPAQRRPRVVGVERLGDAVVWPQRDEDRVGASGTVEPTI